jgi:crotonobetainyl-CoA:carnitine CoA-transferase CaiB-like acyl-CoA transferase
VETTTYPLTGVRVLELSRFVGAAYAAKLCAEFGAEVLALEPPGGHPLRFRPILPGGDSDSLFQYLFTNKTLTAADLGDPSGQRYLCALTDEADIIFTDYPSAELEALYAPLGGLAGLSERRILVRVKPFVGHGQTPDPPATYFTAFHAGGEAYLIPGGEEYTSRPPTKVGQYAGEYDAGLQAALAAMAALYATRRGVTGGDWVEVSVQASAANMVRAALGRYTFDGRIESRGSRGERLGTTIPCADGFVELMPGAEAAWQRLIEVMGNPAWAAQPEFTTPLSRREHVAAINERIREWTRQRSKRQVCELCQRAHIPAGEVASVADVLRSAQMAHRGFFKRSASGRVYPGLPITLGRGALPPVEDPRPNGAEGFQARPEAGPQRAAVGRPDRSGQGRPRPLAGVRVVEFSWYWAVPYAGLLLAALGAEVIKVESRTRPDPMRLADTKPPTEGVPVHETSVMYHDVNVGKRCVTLDLSTPDGKALALELVKRADIVLYNYSVGVMDRQGLGYAAMRAANPDVIVISETACGEDGPDSHFVGFATIFGALSGLQHVTGYPDAPPADLRDGADLRIATTCAVVAVALLLRRQATGAGGDFVSVSAVESCSRFIGEALVELARGGAEYQRNGNDDPVFCPNNAYPCAASDSWVALSVRDDADWQALRRVAALPALDDARFATVAGRRAHREELDYLIGGWTKGYEAERLAVMLQQAGVPASVTATAKMLFEDAALREVGFLPVVEHPYLGRRAVIGVPWEFTRLDARIERAAPLLGEANEAIYGQLLGLTGERLEKLQRQGTI